MTYHKPAIIGTLLKDKIGFYAYGYITWTFDDLKLLKRIKNAIP